MALKDEFVAAQDAVKKLETRPSNDQLLQLYALYKQATRGDVEGERPGALDFKGRAKYDAWATRKGLKKNDAMKQYIVLAEKLG